LEVLKPPYQVVTQQEATPRGKLKVIAARLENSHTLVLATDPHPQPVSYAITIPGVKTAGAAGPGSPVDLDYHLSESLSEADQLSLVRGLPNDREIVAALTKKVRFLGEIKKPQYPFIHAAIAESTLAANGGDYENGRSLFFGEKLKCSTCHRIRGEGASTGPDLNNLTAKDPASVLRDIKRAERFDPSRLCGLQSQFKKRRATHRFRSRSR